MFDPRPVLVAALWLIVANGAYAQEAPVFDTRLAPQAPLDFAASSKDPDPAHYYPDRAQRMEMSGSALLSCTADPQGGLSDCALLSEAPEGWDFGAAALKMARAGLIRKAPPNGLGGKIVVPVTFSPKSVPPRPLPPRRLVGEPPKPAASVTLGETIVGFPFAFNRTAVLHEDVAFRSRWVKGVLARAGSPGFYTGTLHWDRPDATGEVWCFLTLPTEDPSKAVCLVMLGEEAIVIPGGNPYVPVGFATKRGAVLFANAPHFEETAIGIPGDLRLEYRFQGWTPAYAEVEEFAGGRQVILRPLRRQADGRALLQTPAGDYWLTPAPDAPSRAEVTAAAPIALRRVHALEPAP
jgi:TonB family protein